MPVRATAQATKNYADSTWQNNPRISPDSWHMIEDLTISKLGFGTRQCDGQDFKQQALHQALTSGINVVETGPAYHHGAAELMVGATLQQLFNRQILQREQVVLVGHLGPVSTDNLLAWQLSTAPCQPYGHGYSHSLNPAVLERQFEQTCTHLGVEAIDVLMIHAPEQHLTADDYAALHPVFVWCEQMAQQGRISYYGISADSWASPTNGFQLDLNRVMEQAKAAAETAFGRKKRPLLRCISLPFNLLEPHAVRNTNHTAQIIDGTEQVSVLELASRMRLNVLATRPLNSWPKANMPLRLVSSQGVSMAVQRTQVLDQLLALEQQLAELLGGWPALNGKTLPTLSGPVAELLRTPIGAIQAEQLVQNLLAPQQRLLSQSLSLMSLQKPDIAALLDKIEAAYTQGMQTLITLLKFEARETDAAHLRPLIQEVQRRAPAPWQQASLQRVALNTAASTPGITCVLNSMHHSTYVDDAIACMEGGAIVDVAAVLGCA